MVGGKWCFHDGYFLTMVCICKLQVKNDFIPIKKWKLRRIEDKKQVISFKLNLIVANLFFNSGEGPISICTMS